ncbi:MAG: hypothetical protein Q8Q09_15715 [Deltaproteobacteria bacterium]|nr:hypothetical protein [Deltaproteobacteria bacterium]
MSENSVRQTQSGRDLSAPTLPSTLHGDLVRLLRKWRRHIAETQCLGRLAITYLQSDLPNAERRAHVHALFSVEARTLCMLELIDLSGLHTGLTPDQSGVTPIRPDGVLANAHLRAIRDRIVAWLRALSEGTIHATTMGSLGRALAAALDEMAACLELLELFLTPRAHNVSVSLGELVSRSFAVLPRPLEVHCLCDEPRVTQVRGLTRLVSTLAHCATLHSAAKIDRVGASVRLTLPMGRDSVSDERASFLRFCAYLGHVLLGFSPEHITLTLAQA